MKTKNDMKKHSEYIGEDELLNLYILEFAVNMNLIHLQNTDLDIDYTYIDGFKEQDKNKIIQEAVNDPYNIYVMNNISKYLSLVLTFNVNNNNYYLQSNDEEIIKIPSGDVKYNYRTLEKSLTLYIYENFEVMVSKMDMSKMDMRKMEMNNQNILHEYVHNKSENIDDVFDNEDNITNLLELKNNFIPIDENLNDCYDINNLTRIDLFKEDLDKYIKQVRDEEVQKQKPSRGKSIARNLVSLMSPLLLFKKDNTNFKSIYLISAYQVYVDKVRNTIGRHNNVKSREPNDIDFMCYGLSSLFILNLKIDQIKKDHFKLNGNNLQTIKYSNYAVCANSGFILKKYLIVLYQNHLIMKYVPIVF